MLFVIATEQRAGYVTFMPHIRQLCEANLTRERCVSPSQMAVTVQRVSGPQRAHSSHETVCLPNGEQ
jgi:hypothetical protein